MLAFLSLPRGEDQLWHRRPRPHRLHWYQLLARVFAIGVTHWRTEIDRGQSEGTLFCCHNT